MAKKNFSKRETREYTLWRALLQYFMIYFVLYPFFKIVYKAKIIGRENIPKNESFIVVSSHCSYLDPVIVSLAVQRPIAYMAKKQLFEIPYLAQIIDAFGAFAVNKEKLEIATIKTAKAVISTKKWIMAMFPQGGRDIPGQITRMGSGAAYIAKATKAKILPVSIVGSHKYHFLPFSGNLSVRIGKPFEASESLENTMEEWRQIVQSLMDKDIHIINQPEVQEAENKAL